MTQQRALDTRAALIAGAATEFARHGYTATSVNTILDTAGVTKGAMYFHFESKQSMADAVLDEATALYDGIARQWTADNAAHPIDAITGMVTDAADAFAVEPVLRAEARITLDTEFADRRPWATWEDSTLTLAADEATYSAVRRSGRFDTAAFVHILTASMAGHRLRAHLTPSTAGDIVRSGYAQCLDTALRAFGVTRRRTEADQVESV